MENLLANLLIGLGTGLVSGLVTGLYSARIISRRNRFDSLRAELLRHANSIEHMQEPGRVLVTRGSSNKILYVASELTHFGHRKAANAVHAGNKILISALADAERGNIEVAELEDKINDARALFRSVSSSAKVYLPWGQV